MNHSDPKSKTFTVNPFKMRLCKKIEIIFFYSFQIFFDFSNNALGNTPLVTIFPAAGSESATSDIDLPMKGSNTEISVSIINPGFRDYFKVPFDSGMVFDINIYSLVIFFFISEI